MTPFTVRNAGGCLRFHPAKRFTRTDIVRIVATIRTRVMRLFEKRQLRDEDSHVDTDDALAHCYSASLAHTGTRPRAPSQRALHALRAGLSPSRAKPTVGLRAHDEGFDLHAGVVVAANRRHDLEHLCRYLVRPAVSHDRLSLANDGRVNVQLKTPWQDGTTHITLEPMAFCARLAALIPRPRTNLLLYYGVLAANARLRARVVTYGRKTPKKPAPSNDIQKRPQHGWADLMRRTFAVDVTTCPHCAGRLRLMATILNPRTATAILRSLGLPHERVTPCPARAPPDLVDDWNEEVA